LLGCWGPNHAADPIVTRAHPFREGVIQLCATKRGDTGEWAIPGGMVVNIGDGVPRAVRQQFEEEKKKNLSLGADMKHFDYLTNELFSRGNIVYQGYVDDPRNTDNAWMETTATHFHAKSELAQILAFSSSDDVGAFRWLDVDPEDERYQTLFGNHAEWVNRIAFHLTT